MMSAQHHFFRGSKPRSGPRRMTKHRFIMQTTGTAPSGVDFFVQIGKT